MRRRTPVSEPATRPEVYEDVLQALVTKRKIMRITRSKMQRASAMVAADNDVRHACHTYAYQLGKALEIQPVRVKNRRVT